MKPFDLGQILQNTPANGLIQLPPGEYEGSWVINRPMQLIGSGYSTVLWQGKGPVLNIQSPDVKISNLSIEVTSENNSVALELASTLPDLPQFEKVRVLGKIMGHLEWDSWTFPLVINLGKIQGKSNLERTFGLPSVPVTVRSSMTGLMAEVAQSSLGQKSLKLVLDKDVLHPGVLLDGLLEIEMGGIHTLVRITGEVYTNAPTVASHRAGDVQVSEGSDVFAPMASKNSRSKQSILIEAFQPTAGTASPVFPKNTASQASQPKETLTCDNLLEKAEKAEQVKEFELAEHLLKQALSMRSADPIIHQVLARFYERHNNLAQAIIHWVFLKESMPDNLEGIVCLAKCFNKTNQFADSITLLETTLRLPMAKKNVEIFQILAFAYKNDDRIGEAIWALEQALEVKEDKKLTLLLRSWKKMSGNWEMEAS
jgi:hypothetical protein